MYIVTGIVNLTLNTHAEIFSIQTGQIMNKSYPIPIGPWVTTFAA